MSASPYTPTEAKSRQTFLALMWGLSYPGRVQTLPVDQAPGNLFAIGEALVDLETSYFTPDESLNMGLAKTSARHMPAHEAAYHFYPAVSGADLETIRQVTIGDMNFPDRGGTIIIGCKIGSGQALTLTGPGIETENHIEIGGLPEAFWEVRAEHIHYPLGWDIFLVDGPNLIGLPRTTVVSI